MVGVPGELTAHAPAGQRSNPCLKCLARGKELPPNTSPARQGARHLQVHLQKAQVLLGIGTHDGIAA